MLAKIHDHFGYPVDSEWALQDHRFRLLQARPITTLADEYAEPIFDTTEEWAPTVRRPMSLMEASMWCHWLEKIESLASNFGCLATYVMGDELTTRKPLCITEFGETVSE